LVLIDLTAAGTSSAKLKGLGSLGSRLSDHFWNYPLARKAMVAAVRRMPLRFFKRMPTIIVIDVTNSCNLRCPVCPVTFAMHRPRGLMPLDRFKGIVDDFKGQPKKPAMYFNFSGEPTLNKALPDMIAYSTEHGHETFVSTNATKLSDEMIERLVASGLSRINLCIDGFSAEAQEAYRVGSKFDSVKKNIENFIAAKARSGGAKPLTVLQTLLTSYSEKQADDMIDWAKRSGFDQVRFKTFSLGSYTDGDQQSKYAYLVPQNPELQRHQTERIGSFCDVPLYQAVVFWNGDLGLCCIDYDQMIKLPNVDEVGFLKAYMSDEAARARRNGYTKTFEICQSCSYSNADNMGFKIKLNKLRRAEEESKSAEAA
jgi:MoaA/NifB/PqqE/SkfB family radical SAM enzyme